MFCVVPEDQVPGTDRPAAAAATAESDAAAAASCSRTLLAGSSSPIPPGAPCPPWSEQSDTPAGGHRDNISSRRTAAAGGRQARGPCPHLASARSLTKKVDLFLHLLREETDHRAESLHEAAAEVVASTLACHASSCMLACPASSSRAPPEQLVPTPQVGLQQDVSRLLQTQLQCLQQNPGLEHLTGTLTRPPGATRLRPLCRSSHILLK